MNAPTPAVVSVSPEWQWLQALLSYDVLTIRQRLIAIAEKYEVLDPEGGMRFFAVRPPHLFRNSMLGIGLLAVRILILVVAIRYLLAGGAIPVFIAIIIVGNVTLGLGAALLAPYRHIEIFSDESAQWRLFTITQDNKLALWRRYTLYDPTGAPVAILRRSALWAFLRVVWIVETPDGTRLMRVREDSWPRALLRRYFGPLFGLLWTNFNFEFPDGSRFGMFNRKWAIRDQYLLDLRGDTARHADRRVTLAMAILLDTGESR